MSRRKTVALNLEKTNQLIKEVCRSNTVFCEKMERGANNWVSDWNRKDKNGNPAPKNLPSPEEAARMCLLLNTTPEEILLTQGETDEETAKLQADIALVSGLIEQERENQGIKKDLADGEVEESDIDKELRQLWGVASEEVKKQAVSILKVLTKGSGSDETKP